MLTCNKYLLKTTCTVPISICILKLNASDHRQRTEVAKLSKIMKYEIPHIRSINVITWKATVIPLNLFTYSRVLSRLATSLLLMALKGCNSTKRNALQTFALILDKNIKFYIGLHIFLSVPLF